jgi:hypothetical protein
VADVMITDVEIDIPAFEEGDGSCVTPVCVRPLADLGETIEVSTISGHFPHFDIFQRPIFAAGCGVVLLHRKRNLPAEESGIKVVERIGNETHEGSEEAFAADVMTEAREGRGNSPDPSNS